MRKIVLIWRESVYKNHFKCNQCGRRLADKDGTPIRKTMVSDKFAPGFMKCAYCHNVVCRMETGDYPDSIYGLQGNTRSVKTVIDILAAILIIVFGLIAIFLAFSIISVVIYALSDSYLFDQLTKICLATTVILFAVALLLLVGVGAASFVTFSEGA